MSTLEFVGVEVDPLDGEFVVLEGGEVFWGFAGGVDGEGLLGDVTGEIDGGCDGGVEGGEVGGGGRHGSGL